MSERINESRDPVHHPYRTILPGRCGLLDAIRWMRPREEREKAPSFINSSKLRWANKEDSCFSIPLSSKTSRRLSMVSIFKWSSFTGLELTPENAKEIKIASNISNLMVQPVMICGNRAVRKISWPFTPFFYFEMHIDAVKIIGTII